MSDTYNSLSPFFHDPPSPSLLLKQNMLRGAKTEKKFKPKAFLVHLEPTTTKQALAHPEWSKAM